MAKCKRADRTDREGISLMELAEMLQDEVTATT